MTGGARDDAGPVSAMEADIALGWLAGAPRILLAVSGGPDSLALLHLAAAWRVSGLQRGLARPELAVATVDHQLRAESAAEAGLALQAAAAAGLPGEVLVWRGPRPAAGIGAAAREARYRLLFEHARAIGATHVATAHHADDLAETILMRLCAGSGLAGLAGMQADTRRDGLRLVRPLLRLPKTRLIATCRAHGIVWAEDPGNRDPARARGRLRLLAQELERLGLSQERLLRLGARAARASGALEQAADEALAALAPEEFAGGFVLDMRALALRPDEIAVRVLGRLIARAAGPEGAGRVRLERLERTTERLLAGARNGQIVALTFAGLAFRLDGRGVCRAAPQPPRRPARPRRAAGPH